MVCAVRVRYSCCMLLWLQEALGLRAWRVGLQWGRGMLAASPSGPHCHGGGLWHRRRPVRGPPGALLKGMSRGWGGASTYSACRAPESCVK